MAACPVRAVRAPQQLKLTAPPDDQLGSLVGPRGGAVGAGHAQQPTGRAVLRIRLRLWRREATGGGEAEGAGREEARACGICRICRDTLGQAPCMFAPWHAGCGAIVFAAVGVLEMRLGAFGQKATGSSGCEGHLSRLYAFLPSYHQTR